MLGEIFAKTEEACGEIIEKCLLNSTEKVIYELKNKFFPTKSCREYYGMSTRKAQQEFGNSENKTAEGISKFVEIEYTLDQWVDNFKHYLQSAMSYTNSKTLEEFKNAKVEIMSNQSFNSFYK